MSKPLPTDACVLCNKVIITARQPVVKWEQTSCATHTSLQAHYTCFVNEPVLPSCQCPESKGKKVKRFPINHGDSLQTPPLWVNDADEVQQL